MDFQKSIEEFKSVVGKASKYLEFEGFDTSRLEDSAGVEFSLSLSFCKSKDHAVEETDKD